MSQRVLPGEPLPLVPAEARPSYIPREEPLFVEREESTVESSGRLPLEDSFADLLETVNPSNVVCEMKPPADLDDLELHGARRPIISELNYLQDHPLSSQDVTRTRRGTGSKPPLSGSWWNWGFDKNPACDEEGISLRSERSVELALPPISRRFSGVTLHKAAGALGNLSNVKSKVIPTHQEASTAMSVEGHDEPLQSKAIADSKINALPQSSEKRTGFCLGAALSNFAARCAEEIWSRETAFVLREEAQAAKKKPAVHELLALQRTVTEALYIHRCESSSNPAAAAAAAAAAEHYKERQDGDEPKAPSKEASREIIAAQSKGSRESLSLFPLKFTDKSMEAEFAFNQERGARFRNVLGGFIASFLVYVDLAVSAAVWHTGVFMHDTDIFSSYMTFLACCTIFCTAYAISYRIPWVKNYLEYTSYFIATSAVVSQTCLSIWWKSALYSEKNYLKFAPELSRVFALDFSELPSREDSVVYHIVVVYNELFLGIFLQSTLLCVFLLFDVLTPTRFYIATRLQIFNTVIGIIPFIYGAFQLPETFVANIASIVCIITISAAGMVGAYPMEVRRRGLFYEWLKAAGSSSALDDIRSNCSEVGSILAALQKGAGELDVSAGISQALTLTQECLFIFSTCKNLYLTNVNEELKDEAPNLLNAKSAISSTIGRGLGPCLAEKSDPDEPSRLPVGTNEKSAQHAALLLPVVGVDINFNPLEFERTYGDGKTSILLDAGTALLSRVASDWGCDEVVLRSFLVKIDELYQKQPYHNAKHGTLVAHTMSLLCRSLGIFREMNALGVGTCLVAGLCHDVGHPGRNNNFFTSEMSPLVCLRCRSTMCSKESEWRLNCSLNTSAFSHFVFVVAFCLSPDQSIVFNDASVLENFHCSLTFRVLNDPASNLFAFLADAEAREVRSKVIDLILATDMRTHFEFLSRFRTIRGSDQFNHIKNEDDRWLAAELCIRASDIGHGALSWPQHFEWTGLATTEFYLQGDEELRLGRTISPLCDRQSHSQLAKSQIGFLHHVVRPLFVELDSIGKQQKTIADALKNLDDNCDRWEKLGDTVESIVFPRPVREIEAAMNGTSHHLNVSLLTRKDGLKSHSRVAKKASWKAGGEVTSPKEANAASPRGRDPGPPDNLKTDSRGSIAETSAHNEDAGAAKGVADGPTTEPVVKEDKPLSSGDVSGSQMSPKKQASSVGGDSKELASGDVEGPSAADDKDSKESQVSLGATNKPTSHENLVEGNGKEEKISLVIEAPPAEVVSPPAPQSAVADAVAQSSLTIKIGPRAREQAAAETLESPPPSSRSNMSTDSARGVPVPALDKTFFGF
ncbi:hypothetical protein Emed_004462 [Eimeria media]